MTNLVDINFADAEVRVMARIQAVVDNSLNNAGANGYIDLVMEGDMEELVTDMLDYDDDVAELKTELLVEGADPVKWLQPFIEDWRKRKQGEKVDG